MSLVRSKAVSSFDQLLRDARRGKGEALGQLLEGCQTYLQLLARMKLGSDLQPKVGASDIVQKTCLDVQQSIERFEGGTRAEFQAWVERILLNNVADCARQYRNTEKRQLDREVSIGPSAPLDLIADYATPSQHAIAREETESLERALERLPEDYSRVIILRNQDKRPFEEIGVLMSRSTDAAKKLWARAIMSLEKELREE